MDLGQVILNTIRDPNVAYVLLIFGLLIAVLAFSVPGTGFAEIAAGVCLLLAVIGLSQLPVNLAGILLIIAGVGLFLLDLKLQSMALALGGAILLGIGSVFLFEVTATQSGVSLWLIGIVTLGTMAFFIFGVSRVVKAMRLRPSVDISTLVGSQGVVSAELIESNQFRGTAQIGSELWSVQSSVDIPEGTPVVVERIEGLVAYVKPVSGD